MSKLYLSSCVQSFVFVFFKTNKNIHNHMVNIYLYVCTFTHACAFTFVMLCFNSASSKYKTHSVKAKLLYYNGSKICLESLESSLMWQGWADATKTSTALNKKYYEIFRECLKGDWICRGLNVQHRLH